VVHCEGRRLILPVEREGTLVIRDAHELPPHDQQRLLEWWDPRLPHTRIIACASPQLSALVETGAFNRCLFDRFREVQLMLT
jgi:DNA-binding NtrC family response regulator